MNMCIHAYEKINPKNKRSMYFCHRFDQQSDVSNRICVRQRYCAEKNKYVFFKETDCRYYRNRYID